MSTQLQRLNQVKADAILLHDKVKIDSALARLSEFLTQDYADKDPVFLVVMNGGFIFAGNLLPKLNFPLQIDYCHATRYRGDTQGSQLEWKVEPHTNLANRHVVIVDDILDEGHTLNAIIQDCIKRQAASVKTLVLVEKIHERKAVHNMKADYCELTTPDEYVFGYGMDYNHYWRNCEAIYILNQPC
ncbi:hypoxanthine-guanine phosphoribosyltransferase [Aliikangiella maris]|uniref:Hypoxanthine-guanine phosphoribosyltransferase n=2 Tax=Aliikangiella maris TaxID=3162458 RepID=A0ABV2BVB9_9GAMM